MNVTDDDGNISKTISLLKKAEWWKYDQIEGNIKFKPIEWT
jgi:hypothetical protein